MSASNSRRSPALRGAAALLDAAAEILESLEGAVVYRGVDDLSFEFAGVPGLVQVGDLTDRVQLVVITCVAVREAKPSDAFRRWIVDRSGGLLMGSLVLSSGSGDAADEATADLLVRYAFPAAGLDESAMRVLILPVVAAAVEIAGEAAAL